MRNPTDQELAKLDALEGVVEDALRSHALLHAQLLRAIELPRHQFNYQAVNVLSDRTLSIGSNGTFEPIPGFALSEEDCIQYAKSIDALELARETMGERELALKKECGIKAAGVRIDWNVPCWLNRIGKPFVTDD